MSLRCGISNSLEPVLIPNFNFGVAASTTEPCRLVSATTANFVVLDLNLSIHETLAKAFDQYIRHPYRLINCNHTFPLPPVDILIIYEQMFFFNTYKNKCSIKYCSKHKGFMLY